jgi:hypothetical protein
MTPLYNFSTKIPTSTIHPEVHKVFHNLHDAIKHHFNKTSDSSSIDASKPPTSTIHPDVHTVFHNLHKGIHNHINIELYTGLIVSSDSALAGFAVVVFKWYMTPLCTLWKIGWWVLDLQLHL